MRDPLGKFQPQALLCTNQEYSPTQILEWFARRWLLEVTFEETRAHLGVETQRQWSDARNCPHNTYIIGIIFFSDYFGAPNTQTDYSWTVRQTIWYSKSLPTFSDALALVRRFLWASTFSMSPEPTEMIKVPRALFERLRDIAVYAAIHWIKSSLEAVSKEKLREAGLKSAFGESK